MNAIKDIPTLVAATAALAVAAIGLTTGLAPASAAPQQSGADLIITPDPANGANYRLTIQGVYSMNEYDAHGYVNNLHTGIHPPGGMKYFIFSDDPDSNNDRIIGNAHFYPGPGTRTDGYLVAYPDGIHYGQYISVPKGDLNEDDGVFDDIDEIYIQAGFVDGDGGVRKAYSNAVAGNF